MNTLVDYYSRRVAEYDAVYRKPERQSDLRRLEGKVRTLFAGCDVFEIACGTGYWTEQFAPEARSVLGIDASEEMLGLARQRLARFSNVHLQVGDAYAPPPFDARSPGCFCGFFWSHIPRERLEGFLATLRSTLLAGTLLVFIDNRYVAGSNTPIHRTDDNGNTCQIRRLADGTEHEILKNFPTNSELTQALEKIARDVQVEELDYFWIATAYTTDRCP